MSKKKFRAVSQEQPRYPKASELTQSSLCKLGLAALGGLLLGGTAGIPRAQAEENKDAAAKSVRARPNQGGAKKGKPIKGAKEPNAPTPEPRFMPNGGKSAPRIIEVDSPTSARSTEKSPPPKTATTTGTTTMPAPPFPTGGKPTNPRLPEEERSPASNTGTSTATKTDSKKQPEFLPPPGAPPLPRPEPGPLPKKK